MIELLTAEVPQTRDELEFELQRLRGDIELRELHFSRLAAALQERHLREEFAESDQTTIDWLRHNCRMTQQAASDRVRVGEKLAAMPKSEDAFYAGQVGFQHLVVMARTAAAVGGGFDETALLPLALKHSPGKFHHMSMRYRHTVQPKEVAADQRDMADLNCLSLSTAEDGSLFLYGRFDTITGAAIRSTLEPLAKPMGIHDYRDRDKRMADAFFEVVTRNTKVHMQITSSVETLLGLLGAPGAESEFSLPISTKSVERWACDSTLSRVLLQDSIPIDVGRGNRVIKGAKRRALIARDQHCQWPGCERPASWCDGHHLHHWIDGGSTNLENMILLCGRHHRMVHEGDWQIVKTEDDELLPIAPNYFPWMPRGPNYRGRWRGARLTRARWDDEHCSIDMAGSGDLELVRPGGWTRPGDVDARLRSADHEEEEHSVCQLGIPACTLDITPG